MPEYKVMNYLDAQQPLPSFWTGDTDVLCMKQAIGQTLEHGYAPYSTFNGNGSFLINVWY